MTTGASLDRDSSLYTTDLSRYVPGQDALRLRSGCNSYITLDIVDVTDLL